MGPSPSWAPLPARGRFASVWPLLHLYWALHCHMGAFPLYEPPRGRFGGGLRRFYRHPRVTVIFVSLLIVLLKCQLIRVTVAVERFYLCVERRQN